MSVNGTRRARILERRHWIFDMDGTLTHAVHDFDEIRARLGLPPGEPILEALARLPAREAQPLWEQLDAIEVELARKATPQAGVDTLLATLHARGCKLGIVTRNSFANVRETLGACGLQQFFPEPHIKDRDSGAPKPQPDALLELIHHWQAARDDVVMVGDFLYDLQAGRAAGVATVYVDYARTAQWSDHADISVTQLDQLLG
ncbi:MAG: HAD family hydrolase [Gammaproteobacteria bacterium]|nr:HAD family hydrolase [Gammaproteobacteria bacterium]